ncbi:MAG: cytochrome c3 family protein [Thermodesulfobacteriaceae bacterium]
MWLSDLVLSEITEEGFKYQESEEAGGPEIEYTKPVKGVLFSHKLHVKDLGLLCESRHMDIFEMEAFKSQRNPDFNMDSLYKGKYCGACHDGKIAFASNTKCATCHIGVKGLERLKKKAQAVEKK